MLRFDIAKCSSAHFSCTRYSVWRVWHCLPRKDRDTFSSVRRAKIAKSFSRFWCVARHFTLGYNNNNFRYFCHSISIFLYLLQFLVTLFCYWKKKCNRVQLRRTDLTSKSFWRRAYIHALSLNCAEHSRNPSFFIPLPHFFIPQLAFSILLFSIQISRIYVFPSLSRRGWEKEIEEQRVKRGRRKVEAVIDSLLIVDNRAALWSRRCERSSGDLSVECVNMTPSSDRNSISTFRQFGLCWSFNGVTLSPGDSVIAEIAWGRSTAFEGSSLMSGVVGNPQCEPWRRTRGTICCRTKTRRRDSTPSTSPRRS